MLPPAPPEKQPAHLRSGAALYFSLPIAVWALYDFANTIFSSNIVTIFFPFYLQDIVGGSASSNQIASTFITYLNALSSLLLVLFSPLYGVWIDRSGRKKAYLIPFTLVCIASTLGMGAAASWPADGMLAGMLVSLFIVLLLFMIAQFTYNSSLVFYDSMISDLGRDRELPLISGFGVAVGYIGTLVGLSVYPLVGEHMYHKSFIPSALLFLLFSLPLFFLYKEPRRPQPAAGHAASPLSGYREIIETFRDAKRYRPVFLFMIAYFFFNDAVTTAIAVMGVYAKTVIGFSTTKFILLYLVSTVSSIIGSFAFGYVTRAVGAKHSAALVAVVMMASIVLAALAYSEAVFWAAGSLYGIAMGAMWVTSRTLIVELTPEEKRGQFFGLFAFSGKVSAIAGPLLYGSITWAMAGYGNLASRTALGSLLVLVLCGLLVHLRVPYSRKP